MYLITASEDERAVAVATAKVEDFIDRLIDEPIDARLYSDLQTFLEDEAFRAVEARARLLALGPEQLRLRVDEILASAGDRERAAS